MRRLPPLSIFVEMLSERQRALGITEDDFVRARNSGRRRTPEKRELLRRIDGRARKAGAQPFKAHF
jgi:hypothetical protein